MERLVFFEPGFDRRSSDPKKNYGITGMKIRFVLRGEQGAVQFLVGTSWYPEHVQRERHGKVDRYFDVQPLAWDLGFHSIAPRGNGESSFDCDVLPTGKCYYDGSTLNAEPIRDRFLVEGDDAVWEELEVYYQETFGGCV